MELKPRLFGQQARVALLALATMLVVSLFGLSPQLGHVYAVQNTAQEAVNAAALSAENGVIQGLDADVIAAKIKVTLTLKGITLTEDPNTPLTQGAYRLNSYVILGDEAKTQLLLNTFNSDAPLSENAQCIYILLQGVTPGDTAAATSCRAISAPMPLALAADAFTTAGQTGGTYTDSNYPHGKPERRFFLRTDDSEGTGLPSSPPGDFVWLSWLKNNVDDPDALAKALTPPGTTSQGYEEAPWSDNFNRAKPEGYPNQPGIPNEFDAMFGARSMKLGAGYAQTGPNSNDGPSGDANVAAQLKSLVDNKVAFNIPRFNMTNGTVGDKATYLIEGFSSTLIVGYGYLPDGDPQLPGWGKGWYLDLVDLGSPIEYATDPSANVTLTGSTQIKPIHTTTSSQQGITLRGNIAIRPRYGDTTETQEPRDLVFLLDGSNSMNWTWNGTGTYTPGLSDPALAQYVKNGDDLDCVALLAQAKGCQSTEAYKDYTQRRIYQAKQVIANILSAEPWHPADRVAIVTFSGGNADPSTLTTVYPQEGLLPFTDTLTEQVINQAASLHPGSTDSSALYTTSGGSPGALGFQRVQQLFDAAASTGSTDSPKRAVIALTDGLMNVYRNGQQNTSLMIEGNYDLTGAKALPINQAIQQAHVITSANNPHNAAVSVIAMGSTFDQSRLEDMASATTAPYFTTVQDKDAVEQMVVNTRGSITSTCQPMLETVNPVVPSADRTFRYDPASGSYTPETFNGQPSLGVVTVKQSSTIVVTASIRTDGTFEIHNLVPNTTYALSFNNPADGQPVFYQGLDQPEPVFRNYSTIEETNSSELLVHVNDVNLGKVQYVHPADSSTPVVLTFTGSVCPTLAAADPSNTDVTTTDVTTPLPQATGTITRTPVDVVLVMDASGSMNWTWDGRGSYTSISDPMFAKFKKNGDDLDCVTLLVIPNGCQSSEAYKDYTQRRLYLVKQAIKCYLESAAWGPNDRVALVTYNGDMNTLGGNTHYYPTSGLTNNIAELEEDLINLAGSMNPHSTDPSELYRTLGASPGAQALQLAKQVIDTAPNDMQRNRVVVFMTDGLQNVFLNGTRNTPETIEADYDPTDAKALPINEAIQQAGLIKSVSNPKQATVYAIALANTFDHSGLNRIASAPQAPYFTTATSSSALCALLRAIGPQGEPGSCQMEEEDAGVPPANRMFRLVNDTYVHETTASGQPRLGVVTVRDAQGNVVAQADIHEDGTWSVPNLQANTSYTLSFNRPDDNPVFYVGSDGITRNYSIVASTGTDQLAVQTQDGDTQSLPTPVMLVSSEDCLYTAPSQPDATPTTTSTATQTVTATPTSSATSTATSSASSTATGTSTTTRSPTVTTTANKPTVTTFKVYVPLVIQAEPPSVPSVTPSTTMSAMPTVSPGPSATPSASPTTSMTPTSTGNATGVSLQGSVLIKPKFEQTKSGSIPLDLVIVLDASGSMNWTWDGKGTLSADSASALLPYLPSGTQIGDTIDCVALQATPLGCQSTDAYSDYKQRRIYQTKQSLKNFITSFNWHDDDRAALVTFNGNGGDPSTLTHIYPETGLSPVIPQVLASILINQAASKNPDSTDPAALYTTIGASPGASGLERAKQLLDSASDTGERNRIVLFLTDGVQNVFLNGQRTTSDTIEANYNPTGQQSLPVNQMIDQANAIKDAQNPRHATIYAVALSNTFNLTGLPYVGSARVVPYFSNVTNASSLNSVLQDIMSQQTDSVCVPQELSPQVPEASRMFRYNAATGTFTPETFDGQPSLGRVTVKQNGGKIIATANIAPDGTFTLPNLQAHTNYVLSFNRPNDGQLVFYQGQDGVYRNYSLIASSTTDELVVQMQDDPTQSLATPVLLLLNGEVCLNNS